MAATNRGWEKNLKTLFLLDSNFSYSSTPTFPSLKFTPISTRKSGSHLAKDKE